MIKAVIGLMLVIPFIGLPKVHAQTPTPTVRQDEVHVIKSAHGAALSTIGHFDIGLKNKPNRWSSLQVSAPLIGGAVSNFILADRQRFGLSANETFQLRLRSVDRLDDKTVVTRINQFVGDLRVLDSDLNAVFEADGALQSLNGLVVPNRLPKARASSTASEILEVLRKDPKAAAMGDLGEFGKDGEGKWRRQDGAELNVGWSRRDDRPVWKAWLPEEVLWIDDESKNILHRETQRRYGPTGPCKVKHRVWPTASDGRASSLAEASNTTKVVTLPCQADDWFSTCYWKLQMQPFGFKHAIDRVQDEDAGEAEASQACGSSTIPEFIPSFALDDEHKLRQMGAYYVVYQMRRHMDEKVWSQVAPNRDATLHIHLDDDNTVYPAGSGLNGPAAWFNGFLKEIRAHSQRFQQEIFMHEYGHYVVWTYAEPWISTCEQSVDESAALNETLANVFAGLYARAASIDINPNYGAYSGLVGAPSPHTDASSLLMSDVNCNTAIDIAHGHGEAFEQAVWELIFNKNCTIDACTGTSGQGNRIWVGASRSDVLRHVGAALGFSLKAIGLNVSHSQIAAQMVQKIRMDSGSATANRAKAVFVHHGVL